MEEVVRFLERCYQGIDPIQKNNKLFRSQNTLNGLLLESTSQPTKKADRRLSDNGTTRIADKSMENGSAESDALNESFTSTSTSIDSFKTYLDFPWYVYSHIGSLSSGPGIGSSKKPDKFPFG